MSNTRFCPNIPTTVAKFPSGAPRAFSGSRIRPDVEGSISSLVILAESAEIVGAGGHEIEDFVASPGRVETHQQAC